MAEPDKRGGQYWVWFGFMAASAVPSLFLLARASIQSIALPGSYHSLFGFWMPFGILGLISWSVWFLRRFLTSLYSPCNTDYWSETSVVAPVFREDLKVLEPAIRSWLAANVSEINLVMPKDEPERVEEVKLAFAQEPKLHMYTTDWPDKRNSLALGIKAATKPIVILTDSDTLWEPDLVQKVLMPFADEQVGGVGTRQRVLFPETSIWRRAADWMLDSRYLTYVPAMARKGAVSCLSGRTVAYRRKILLKVLPDLVNETFWGRRCVSGDDGRLTWLVLNEGYKTAHQSNALAWTMMPDNAQGFLKQRIRWSRNSWRCYLRAVFRGWIFRQPAITRLSVFQGLLAPFSLTIGFGFAGLALKRGAVLHVVLWLLWLCLGRGIRAIDHLREDRRNLALIPLMTFITLGVLTLVKYYTLVTMNKQAWLTRREDRDVAEGQSANTLGDTATMNLQARRSFPSRSAS